MQQLTPMDAIFLSMETPETPGHIGGLAILDPSHLPDGQLEYESFVDFVKERLSLVPRFSWRLQEVPLGLDAPYWVEVEDLDYRKQIRRIGVPAPGGHEELSELAGYLFAPGLDRSKPLWDMFFIEGLQGGRVALLWRVHHCLMDGVSGAGLVEMLFDLDSTPASAPLVQVDDSAKAGGEVGPLAMAGNAMWNSLGRPGAMLEHLGSAAKHAIDGLREPTGESATVPSVSFNGSLGTQRSVAWSRIPLDRVKAMKQRLGVTVNDVVLEITGDAVRRYLEKRGELPEESLAAVVPVSLREKGDKSIGNNISEINIYWGTDVADPIERLFAIHEAATKAKHAAKAGGPNLIAAMAESLAPGAMSLFARFAAATAESLPLPGNAVVSNVPMSPVPLYIAGAKIEGMVPMSLLAPTQGFNITVISYAGEMHFGVIADPDLVDSVWELADALPKALLDLEEQASRDSRWGDVTA